MGAANVEPAPLIVPDAPLEPADPLGDGALEFELELELPHAATTSAAPIAKAVAVI
jgi:hypothetical protein